LSQTTNATLPARSARLLLLDAQGLLDDCSAPCSPAAVRKLIGRLGYVQLDSINVVERAHHLTLFARRRNYRREHLDRLYARRHIFEGWTHDASILPIEWFGRWHHRRQRFMDRGWGARWVAKRIGPDADKVFAMVLDRIRREGPLRSADFEHDEQRFGPRGESAWWGWKPAKAALEYLWWRGDLCVAARPHFQKVYDLAERVVPAEHREPPCSREEFVTWAVREAMIRLIVATAAEVAGFFAAISLAEARAALEAMAKAGELERALVESEADGGGRRPTASYAVPDWKARLRRAERALTKTNGAVRLLAPFDPVARDRKRLARLFNFDYRFEAFTPGHKRVHGYYVLPILAGDRFIARADLKHDRREGILHVNYLKWEPGASRLEDELQEELLRMAAFVGADRIVRPRRREPG
jgi:hypothetical protein